MDGFSLFLIFYSGTTNETNSECPELRSFSNGSCCPLSTIAKHGFCCPGYVIDESVFFLYCLIPSFLIIIILSAVKKRKLLWPQTAGGRPGLIYPINLLQDHEQRFSIATAFALTTFVMLNLILGNGEYPFPHSEVPFGQGPFYKLAAWIIYALVYYPVFVCLSTKSTISYGLGTFYVWFLTTEKLINNGYCWMGDQAALALSIIEDLPAWYCYAWLCVIFPIRFIKKFFHAKFPVKYSMKSDQLRFQIDHVEKIFKRHRQPPPEKMGLIKSLVQKMKYQQNSSKFCEIHTR